MHSEKENRIEYINFSSLNEYLSYIRTFCRDITFYPVDDSYIIVASGPIEER